VTVEDGAGARVLAAVQRELNRVPEGRRAAALGRLRDGFLSGDVPVRYLDAEDTLAAYAELFFPQSFAKAASVLDEIAITGATRVIDIGSGMGPLAFAAWTRFPHARFELIDVSQLALDFAARIAGQVGAEIRSRVCQAADADTSAADLVLAGNVLGELAGGEQEALALCRKWLAALRDGGTLILIEPADRSHARNLQALRDGLLSAGFSPIAPCPHGGPCPASVRPRDFCHQARTLPTPLWLEAARARAGISDPRLRFSYLVYRRDRSPPASDALRIISHPLKEKGRLRFFACGREGLVELMRQDRLASERNAVFAELGRGALVRVAARGTRIKLSADDVLEVIGPPDPWAGG
jgi:ribosomal protein RSM22 (predicted rRNA methylase)